MTLFPVLRMFLPSDEIIGFSANSTAPLSETIFESSVCEKYTVYEYFISAERTRFANK